MTVDEHNAQAEEPIQGEPKPASDLVTMAEPSTDQPEATETPSAVESPSLPQDEPPAAEDATEEAPARDEEADHALFEAAMSALSSGEEADVEGTFRKLVKGERLEATVIQVDNDRLFVDLGTKSEGIVPMSELSNESIQSAKDHFQVGDKISVVVLRPEGNEGNPIVSKKRADFEEAWDKIEQALQTQEVVVAPVVDRVKGGLVVDIGVRGFVPATHVQSGKLRNIEKYVGQSLPFKIIEIDRDRRKVVLSNRLAEEERRTEMKEHIFNQVAPGDVVEGTVRRLTDYGAFVDLGGVDGLLHISEMSWMRITHPREMFKEGQKIKVMVLRLDPNLGKISLGHRQVLPDPWNLIRENYRIGRKFTVQIGRLVQSGAFVKLPEGAEAFLPLSEMSFRRIRRPEDVVAEGQEVEVQIIDLRPEERRMVLSIRAAGGVPPAGERVHVDPTPGYEPDDDRGDKRRGGKKKKGRRGGHDDEGFEDVVGRRGFASGGATIGERLGMLKGFLGREEIEEEEAEESEEAKPDSATTE